MQTLLRISFLLHEKVRLPLLLRVFNVLFTPGTYGWRPLVTLPLLTVAIGALGVRDMLTRHFRMVGQLVAFRGTLVKAAVERGTAEIFALANGRCRVETGRTNSHHIHHPDIPHQSL